MKTNETKKIVEDLLAQSTLNIESVLVECDDLSGAIWCKIRSNDSNLLIGRDGEVLIALNHLVKRIMEKQNLIQVPKDQDETSLKVSLEPSIIIDVNDYQKKKIENLKNLAHMLSERAIFFKSSISADPMSSYDRRIIHEFLAEKSNIKTESVGMGRERRVVIKYVE